MKKELILIKTAFPSNEEADKIAKELLNKKYIASAQSHEIKSLYFWKDAFCDKTEIELTCITREDLYFTIKKYFKSTHSYELPQIICTPVTNASEEFYNWVLEQTAKVNAGVVHAYSDGACSPNPGLGGWGAVNIIDGQVFEYSGYERASTNNRMELMGAINALKNISEPSDVILTTDSSYVCNGIEKGWVKSWKKNGWVKSDGKKALNPDLWQELLDQIDRHNSVKFEWVKGHASNEYNNRCDQLAVEARLKLL